MGEETVHKLAALASDGKVYGIGAYRLIMKLIGAKYLSAEEHGRCLSTAGYSDVEIRVEPRKGWLCAIAKRPV